jgi:hypothetical protein
VSPAELGFDRVVPLTLGLTFLVLPSTSTRIFRAFLCETFEYDGHTSRRYLYADLTLSCNSDEYESTKATAFAMLAVWPVGVPILYTRYCGRAARHSSQATRRS